MKKSITLFLSLVMTLSLVTALAGCGDEPLPTIPVTNNTEPKTIPTESSAATQATDEPVTEPTESQAIEETTEPTTPEATAAAVPLGELDVITKEFYTSDKQVTDTYGNDYDGTHFEFVSYGQNSSKDQFITQGVGEFAVDGKYGYLTGTFFTRSGQEEDAQIELMVYADDELVYYSGPVSRRTRAVELAVDIGYCDVLRIASRSYDYSSNTNPGIILTNAFVYEDFDGDLTEGEYLNTDLTPLTDLHIYNSDCTIAAGPEEDSFGNVYRGIYLDLCSWAGSTPRDAFAEFVTDGEYNYLSGTIFTRTEQSEAYAIEFKVYGDDQLLYGSGTMNRSTKAIELCVDISGYDIVRVETTSPNYTSSGTNPGVILMNAMVSTQEP